MTSFAFILGTLPLVTSTGAGAELRQALGTAVFFGMIGVTIFGLFLTPVFYVAIRSLVLWIRGGRKDDKAMHCPKCRGVMRTYTRNGVHIEQCDNCRGIFLDYGELRP